MSLGIDIKGIPDLKAALEAVGNKVKKQTAYQAVVEAMTPVVIAARRYARRSVETGNLHESIGLKATPKLRKGRMYAIVGPRRKFKKPDPSGKGERIATSYAHLVEFGTSTAPAKPFLRPAWAVTKARVNATLQSTLSAGILAEAKRRASRKPRK